MDYKTAVVMVMKVNIHNAKQVAILLIFTTKNGAGGLQKQTKNHT
jgi:hypothetical protein